MVYNIFIKLIILQIYDYRLSFDVKKLIELRTLRKQYN